MTPKEQYKQAYGLMRLIGQAEEQGDEIGELYDELFVFDSKFTDAAADSYWRLFYYEPFAGERVELSLVGSVEQ